jgi:response regulator of citrate/malate metabolism
MNSVLLIDNDTVSNFHNERIILKINKVAKVMIAANGKEAIGWILQGNYPDLILIDIKIPKDSFEFLRIFNNHYLKHKGKTTIAALSNSTYFEDRRKIQKMEISHHLLKPLTEEKLYQLLSDLKITLQDGY